MEDNLKKTYYGKIRGINTSDNVFNILVSLPDGKEVNIKTKVPAKEFTVGALYRFNVSIFPNSERSICNLDDYVKVVDLEGTDEVDMAYRLFDKSCPYTKKELQDGIENYLVQITNPIIKNITKAIMESNEGLFYIYPAAQRFHHNYVGGLAYHTYGMLKLADSMIANYPYLDKSYLYAGVILHDIGKVLEFSGVENTEYTLRGQLLGHLVMGSLNVALVAKQLGYENTEEAMLLEHMIISHHGQPMFGACKRPQTPEAMMLWYIDTLDSKFRVLGEELSKTEPGKFTDVIGVLDKTKIYKKK